MIILRLLRILIIFLRLSFLLIYDFGPAFGDSDDDDLDLGDNQGKNEDGSCVRDPSPPLFTNAACNRKSCMSYP